MHAETLGFQKPKRQWALGWESRAGKKTQIRRNSKGSFFSFTGLASSARGLKIGGQLGEILGGSPHSSQLWDGTIDVLWVTRSCLNDWNASGLHDVGRG